MKITEVKNLSKYLVGAFPIGRGTTAVCFYMPSGKILKVYYDNNFKKFMMERIDILSEVGNDSYIAPEEILIKDGKCIAQIYEYVYAPTLHKICPSLTVGEILKAYEKLIEDTKEISKKSFELLDLHDKNILFDDFFYVIDLDKGYINERLTKEIIQSINIRKINEVILYSIFKTKWYEVIEFCDSEIQKIYSDSLSKYEEFPALLERIKYKGIDDNIKTLSKRIKFKKSINSYKIN